MWWTALAGCAVAAAVGCRPTHLIMVPVCAFILIGAKLCTTNTRQAALHVAAFAGPIALGCALLGWYNHARFGDILEFGQRYQLGVADFTSTPLCSLERAIRAPVLVAIQSWYLLFQPFYLTTDYPFLDFNRIEHLNLPWQPPDYLGSDPITGLFSVSPLLIPGLFATALVLRRGSRVTQLYCGGCLVIAAVALAYLHTCAFAAARFLFEILSVLLIATLPALWHACSTNSPAGNRSAGRVAWQIVTAAGLALGLCIGIAGSLGGHFNKGQDTLSLFQRLLGMPETEIFPSRSYAAPESAQWSSGDEQMKYEFSNPLLP